MIAREHPGGSHQNVVGRGESVTLPAGFPAVDQALLEGEIVGIFPEGKLTTDGEIAAFKSGLERILKVRPVPVVPMAIKGMWTSLFSRRDSRLGRLRIPSRFRAHVELEAAAAIPGEHATAAGLEEIVRQLRGDRA